MNSKLTTKEMIIVICALRNHPTGIVNNGKEYEDLLNYLFSFDNVWNEDTPYPTIKKICAATGISSGKLKRLTTLIFKDLITDRDQDLVLNINRVEYVFAISYFDKYLYFIVDELPELPRVGETIRIDHFFSYIGCKYFHVSEITHEFIDTKQSITISLKGGSYNKYWHIRKDEADCKNEISAHDSLFMNDYEIKKKLGILY